MQSQPVIINTTSFVCLPPLWYAALLLQERILHKKRGQVSHSWKDFLVVLTGLHAESE